MPEVQAFIQLLEARAREIDRLLQILPVDPEQAEAVFAELLAACEERLGFVSKTRLLFPDQADYFSKPVGHPFYPLAFSQ
jgi:hypothetical protein